MARLQILELPAGAGFVLVIDQAPRDENSLAFREDVKNNEIAAGIGARHVLVFEDTVDIPANDTTAYLDAGSDPLAEALFDAERYKQDHLGACRTIAAMHAAATGRTGEGPIRGVVEDVEDVRLRLEQAKQERDEARTWARHGYEIGQKHCGWSDHGVAPAWLTEGWPPRFDSCEHLKQAAEYDTALSRVLEVASDLETLEAHGGAWDANQQAARCIRQAVDRPRDDEASGS